MTPIETLLKACHTANFVHFPNGLIIFRSGSGWAVRICRGDTETISSVTADAKGPTPEAAIECLRQKIAEVLELKSSRHAKDAAESRATLLQLRGSEP